MQFSELGTSDRDRYESMRIGGGFCNVYHLQLCDLKYYLTQKIRIHVVLPDTKYPVIRGLERVKVGYGYSSDKNTFFLLKFI